MEPAAKRSRLAENESSVAKRVEASIGDLSDELLAHIFSFFSLEEAWPLRPVCKAWRGTIQVSVFRKLSAPCYKFNGEDLRAVARLPELRSLEGFKIDDDVSREDVAALGAAPKLGWLDIRFRRAAGSAAPFIAGLADAVRASRSFKDLSLVLDAPGGTDPAALADFVAVASRVPDHRLNLFIRRPLAAEEVAALAACSSPWRVEIRCFLDSGADLLVLEGLRGLNAHLNMHVGTDDALLYSAAKGVLSGWRQDVKVYYPKNKLPQQH
eukprot:tig00021622_g22997.t1